MAIQISGTTVINDSRKGIFNSVNFGAYTTAGRPAAPSTGDVIYNTTDAKMQVWNGSSWVNTR